MKALTPERRARVLASLPDDVAEVLAHDWRGMLARDGQIAPPGDWATWLILAGRGFGKTRTGAEWCNELAASGHYPIIHLVGATAADVRDVMVGGPSGIVTVSPPWFQAKHYPSKRRVEWPNGTVGLCFSADEPRQLRGPQCHAAWADELAAWTKVDAWDQLSLGLRLGQDPRMCVTTTPRPTKVIRELLSDRFTAVTKGSTYDNRANLAKKFFDKLIKRHEGTRLGRQELLAELLDDTPGALWTLTTLDASRVRDEPDLQRTAVAVDPATTSGDEADETGIVGGGVASTGHGYTLADRSLRGSPDEWGRAAVLLHDELEAAFVVAEANQGGEMVEFVVKAAAAALHREGKRKSATIVVKLVHASKGKRPRAEPVAQLYEQARIHHVGTLSALEDQMTTWDASSTAESPDRVDALVWLWTELLVDADAEPISPSTATKLTQRARGLFRSR